MVGFVWDYTFSLKLLLLCHERQYFFFFLFVLFQERCFPSVSFTSNSNFSFKIVWPASVHVSTAFWNLKYFLRGVRRILKASCLSNQFNNWWVVRDENVYTGRFPFKMPLYVNDSFFSFFIECCAFVHNRVEKGCFSVRYFGHKFYSQ